MTGKTVWRVERPTNALHESPDSYTTPALLQYDGKTEIVITGGDLVTGHDPATGKELWRADVLNPQKSRNYRIISSPIVAGGLIIAPTRVNPLVALRPGGSGDVAQTHVAWTFHRGPRRAVTGQRRQVPVSRDRAGGRLCPGAADRQTRLRPRTDPERLLQRLARAGGRQDLRDRRVDGRHNGAARRAEVRDPGVEHVQRSVRACTAWHRWPCRRGSCSSRRTRICGLLGNAGSRVATFAGHPCSAAGRREERPIASGDVEIDIRLRSRRRTSDR